MTEPMIKGFDQQGRPVEIPRSKWAAEMLPQALKQAESDPAALANLVGFALQNGCAAEVVESARKLARNDPDRVRGRNLFGAALAASGKYEEAEKELENLLVFAGDEPTALVNLAQLKARKGEHEAASDCVKRALHADPNHASAFEIVASNARKRNGDAGFLSACRELAKDPRSWRARLWLARARLGLGEIDAAVALYRESMPHAKASGEALTQITGDLANAGRLAEAAELALPVYRAQVHGPYVAVNLARVLMALGRKDDAGAIVAEGKKTFGAPWVPTFEALEKELAGGKPSGEGA
jgi:Flp pilus assembly protein TadD